MIKTRLQIYDLNHSATPDSQPLLSQQQRPTRPSSFSIARSAYQTEGAAVFFRGIGICSARAFIVNAVQWGVSASYLGGINSTQDCANSVLCTGLRVDHEKPQLGSNAFGSLNLNTENEQTCQNFCPSRRDNAAVFRPTISMSFKSYRYIYTYNIHPIH